MITTPAAFDSTGSSAWSGAGAGEQPCSLADDNEIREQDDLVYQIAFEQPSDHGAAEPLQHTVDRNVCHGRAFHAFFPFLVGEWSVDKERSRIDFA
ncbi:MAG TPA: hypothetical protein VE569_10670 [Acidimicrobiia bacterium]|nr:hypothetical protein [Acidimicrobiia bacterium]